MNIQKTVANFRAKLEIVERFAATYGPRLPDNFPGHLGTEYGLTFGAHIPEHATRADAERLLALTGEIFGRDGWTRRLSYHKTHFDWHRNIDGVEVCVMNVEKVEDPRDGSPVLPNAFPILLPETAEAV